MFVLSARLATAGAVVTVAAKCGVAYPLAHRLPGGDAVVIVIVVLAVTALAATGHEVPTTLGGAGGRGRGRQPARAFGRAL
uniref:Cation/H+ exchanger domain-containing protein n=1 Tax=Streptomyces sp. NBC_01393 TaxID=2903851 RepID=A0AAU3HR69_9ACTN